MRRFYLIALALIAVAAPARAADRLLVVASFPILGDLGCNVSGGRDIAGIITQIRASRIPAAFPENISDPRLIRQIAAETGARICGTLYSDSLTGEKGDSPTYIEMVRHNIKALTSALNP